MSRERYLVGDESFARELTLEHETIRTTGLVCRGERVAVQGHELQIVLDAAHWRHDIPHWRWCRWDATGGQEVGLAAPDFDDSAWDVCPHLHPLFYPSYDGYAWFRHELVLPNALEDEQITLVLGGLDDEDWTEYRVFLDGEELARRRGEGVRRDPHAITLSPGDDLYRLLRFGEPVLLAIETRELRRPVPEKQRRESEHLLFQDWLVDQFVTAAQPYRVIEDWTVTGVAPSGGKYLDSLAVDLVAADDEALQATLTYARHEDALRKVVSVANRGAQSIRLLDVGAEDWHGIDGSRGGRGQPVLTESLFAGLEHPAGVNRGSSERITVQQFPGIALAAGETFTSEPSVVGLAPPGMTSDAAFRSYLVGLRPRRRERLTVYSPLGWFDFTNPADPLPELTEELVEENLEQLERLRDANADFDVYMLDDWWEPTDLGSFRHRTFPGGTELTMERIRAAGLAPGIWWGTTRAVWTCDQAPGIEAAVAGGSGLSPDRPPTNDGSEWSWDEEWGALFTREKRLCLGAEPYRGMFQDALAGFARDHCAALFKCDTGTLHCTSDAHDHLPGRYSVEPIARAVVELIERTREANPEVFFVMYWTFRSPWWLRFADTMFDKGLKMELASPSTTPAPVYRQSIGLHLDQAARHASLLPLPLQDSLGLWWGNVALTNRFGKEEWRDAFLLDIGRGSTLVQCWGDLTMLDDDDTRFLSETLDWVRSHGPAFWTTIPVGGDPREAEPYGYAQRTEENGAIVTVSNPSLDARQVSVDLASLVTRPDDLAIVELYPFPGTAQTSLASLELAPFEVRVLELIQSEAAADFAPQSRPEIRATRHVDVSSLEPVDGDGNHLRGAISMPQIGRHDRVAFVARFHRDGVWWNHPDPRGLVSVHISLDGFEVYSEVVPAVRARTGLGSSWVLWSIPAGPAWSGRTLDIELRAELPDGVELAVEAAVFEHWWARHRRRFQSLGCGGAPAAAG